MKTLHLIDSLNAGGAERMAVAYANAIAEAGHTSFFLAGRKEGPLKESLLPEVHYTFLNRKSKLDIPALLLARGLIRRHGIQLVHAHGTSWFFATLLKFTCPELQLIWHDHYGLSENLENRPYKILSYCSRYFDAVFSVNRELKEWAENTLHVQKVYYIKNFTEIPSNDSSTYDLAGEEDGRLVCLANLREQKDHFNLLSAFRIAVEKYPRLTLHLFGKDFKDAYSKKLRAFIETSGLSEKVFVHGSRKEVSGLLEQCSIGMISSASEGLPVALLEYGMAGLPVVVTDVGYCREVVNGHGKTVPAKDPECLAQAITDYMDNPQQRKQDARAFQNHIKTTYSREAVFPEILKIYEEILKEKDSL